jgi:transcriptional accessory protein Tex/SPT6
LLISLRALGAGHILAEDYGERPDLRQRARGSIASRALVSTKIAAMKSRHHRDYLERSGFITFRHRAMAINRGEAKCSA